MHPHLYHLTIDSTLLSSWAVSPGPLLTVLICLNIFVPNLYKATEHTKLILLPLDKSLNTLRHMPALEAIMLYYCLLLFNPSYSTCTVPLLHLHTLNFHNHIDRCSTHLIYCLQNNKSLLLVCLSASQHNCLHILPLLSAYLCHPKSITTTNISSSSSSSNGSSGLYALSLSFTSINSYTMFTLMAWCSFFLLTLTKDHKQYFSPQGIADVWLKSK